MLMKKDALICIINPHYANVAQSADTSLVLNKHFCVLLC